MKVGGPKAAAFLVTLWTGVGGCCGSPLLLASNRDVGDCLRCAMTESMQLNDGYETNGLPSWRTLAKAVYSLDRRIFNRIAEKHPGTVITVGLAIIISKLQ